MEQPPQTNPACGGWPEPIFSRGGSEVTDPSPSFEDAVKIMAKLFVNSAGKIHVAVDMPKLTLSIVEFRVLRGIPPTPSLREAHTPAYYNPTQQSFHL